MVFSSLIRARLRRLIRQYGVSQSGLGSVLGITPVTLSRLLSGWSPTGDHPRMTMQQVDQILDALELQASIILKPVELDANELQILRWVDEGRSKDKMADAKRRIQDLVDEGDYLQQTEFGLVLTDLGKIALQVKRPGL